MTGPSPYTHIMQRIRWAATLAAANVVVAVSLSWVGLVQYERDYRLHPGYFYHGNMYYLPTAQVVMYCLNAPSYVASNWFVDSAIRYFGSSADIFAAHAFFYVNIAFYVATAGFWWLLGMQLDRKRRANVPRRAAIIIAYV